LCLVHGLSLFTASPPLSTPIVKFQVTTTVINHTLRANGIPSIGINEGGKGSAVKVFDQDTKLRIMLLYGEHKNAGLNIVYASYVFLLESVVNHVFEVHSTWLDIVNSTFVAEEPLQPSPGSITCLSHGRLKVGSHSPLPFNQLLIHSVLQCSVIMRRA
jgi:hypothetical protein